MPEYLVHLVFEQGTVSYLPNFLVVVTGKIWPRELGAANSIIRESKAVLEMSCPRTTTTKREI